MDPSHELALLERDIDASRTRLKLDRKLLADQLAPHGGDADTVDALLSSLDEFGAAHVAASLASDPERHNLTALPTERLSVARGLLERLADESYDFDHLVGAREALLSQANPGRRRIYPWFGREFAFDDGGRKLRFLDGQAPLETASLDAVPNRIAPAREPDLDPTLKTRPRRGPSP